MNVIAVDFQCFECKHIFEELLEDSDTDTMQCPKCHRIAKRIVTFRGGFRADPTWLDSACEVLQPDGERPIESRFEFDKYLKKHDIGQRC
jgi:putative FmdB family regulatory protein